jgi:hypothetical protein
LIPGLEEVSDVRDNSRMASAFILPLLYRPGQDVMW